MTQTLFSDLRPRLALLGASILWASAFVGIRAGLHGYSPGGLALLRFLVASLCMLLILPGLPRLRKRISRRDKFALLLVGAIGLGCYNLALNFGEVTVTSGVASFIVSLSPVVTLVFANLLLGESFSAGMIVGMLVSIAGVGVIAASEISQMQFDYGLLLVLVATVICGLYSVLQKPFLKRYDATEVTAWIMWGCTLSLFYYFGDMWKELTHAEWSATLPVIYLGIFPAALGYLAWSYGLRAISASRAAGYLYYMPVFASILGWLWLGEVPTLLSLLGGSIVLMGVWIVSHQQRKRVMQGGFPG